MEIVSVQRPGRKLHWNKRLYKRALAHHWSYVAFPSHCGWDAVEPISSPTDRNAATMVVAAAAAAAKKASIDCVPGSVRRLSGKFTPARAAVACPYVLVRCQSWSLS